MSAEPQRNTTLVQRCQDQIALWQLIDEQGGEITPVMEKWIAEIDTAIASKADGYKAVLDSLDDEVARLKTRAKDFSEASKSVERIGDRIRDRMKFAIKALGVDEVVGTDYRFKLVKARAALVVDEAELPAKFLMQITQTVPDRTRIASAMESGEFVPGAHYEESFALRSYVVKKGK